MERKIEKFHLLDKTDVFLIRGFFPDIESQHHAIRDIISNVIGVDEVLVHYPSGRPYLVSRSCNISISHCKKAVGIATSRYTRLGFDVEYRSDKLEKVAYKFLPEIEYRTSLMSQVFLISAWTFKEAAFKLLNSEIEGPKVLTDISVYDNRLVRATCHLDDVTFTVVRDKTINLI